MKRILSLILLISIFFAWNLSAAYSAGKVDVTITMNSISSEITLTNDVTGEIIPVGDRSNTPKNYSYNFNAEPGIYTLAAFTSESNGSLSNGSIKINITDDSAQIFEICTVTAGADNKDWILDTDYTLEYYSISREGVIRNTTPGISSSANKITFLMHIGDSYCVEYIPNAEKAKEGYMTYTAIATVTNNTQTVRGSMPLGSSYSVTIPKDAKLFLGKKYNHYVAFAEVNPIDMQEENNKITYNFHLAQGQVYNYRVSQTGKLTTAGKFTMSSTLAPLEIAEEILNIDDPKRIDHDVKSNSGLNVGDILLNINERGHLKMAKEEEYRLIPIRNWQLSDNSTNNYFIEPDFHYTIINENGTKEEQIIAIDENGTIKAFNNGTAIVLVNYDAIYLPGYWGGPFFGAIWPENTGVFVVTVGQTDSGIIPNITINEALNSNTMKLAGDAVDAEHDIFYYLKGADGYDYTFKPEGVSSVSMAQPHVGDNTTHYTGFSNEGVTKNEDGSYTVRLIHGRNIVKLTGTNGNSEYQIFTAKPTEFEIRNVTNPGEQIQQGDKVSVVFKGLFHPANKLSAIYNMSAYIQYKGTPDGTSLILSSNQYTFGSSEGAQTMSFIIPEDWDINEKMTFTNGVIQVNGFGDPIGNHRNTSPDFGRHPNFTAVTHKTYFGSIPPVSITVNETKYYQVTFTGLPENTDFTLFDSQNKLIEPQESGSYSISYGTYSYIAHSNGYKVLRDNLSISSESPETQIINLQMSEISSNGWDGITLTEPETVTSEESQTTGGLFEGMENYYKISSGYELAWFANQVNTSDDSVNAVVTNDIDLCGYNWTPIGKNNLNSNALAFKGIFKGANHSIEGMYVKGTKSFWAFFGCIDGATITNLSIKGDVLFDSSAGTTGYYFGGLVAWAKGNFIIENCHNYAHVTGGGYTGGILGYSASSQFTLNNCSNYGNISGSTNIGGIMGYITSFTETANNLYNAGTVKATSSNAGGIVAQLSNREGIIKNALNIGEISASTATSTGSIKGTGSGEIINAYSVYEYNDKESVTQTNEEELASGRIAWLLGDAFGQVITTDESPSLGKEKVYKVDYTTNLQEQTETIYINKVLPVMEKEGYTSNWYSAPNEDIITEISEDSILYLLYSPIRVESITISKEQSELQVQETLQLYVTINPENALNKELIWTSSNPSVASVDEEGLVEALNPGTTTILVISEDGRYVQRCEITVIKTNVGIDNPTLTANLYPNPVQDRLFIDNHGIAMDKIIITDLKGNRIYENEGNNSIVELPVTHWNEGIYLIQIITKENTKNYKLLKTK